MQVRPHVSHSTAVRSARGPRRKSRDPSHMPQTTPRSATTTEPRENDKAPENFNRELLLLGADTSVDAGLLGPEVIRATCQWCGGHQDSHKLRYILAPCRPTKRVDPAHGPGRAGGSKKRFRGHASPRKQAAQPNIHTLEYGFGHFTPEPLFKVQINISCHFIVFYYQKENDDNDQCRPYDL